MTAQTSEALTEAFPVTEPTGPALRPVAPAAQPVADEGTPLTPSQQGAILRNRMRAAASAAGRPQVRSSRPGLYLAGPVSHVLFVHKGALLAVEIPVLDGKAVAALPRTQIGSVTLPVHSPGPAVPVTITSLADMLTPAYRKIPSTDKFPTKVHDAYGAMFREDDTEQAQVVLFADADAYKAAQRLIRLAGKTRTAVMDTHLAATPFGSVKGLSLLFEYRKGLTNSGFMPILTHALAHRFWPQAGIDETTLDGWAAAFGLTGTPMHRITSLLAATLGGTVLKIAKNNLIACEVFGSASARSTSALSTSKAFKQANSLQEIWSSINASDPTLIEHNTITGAAGKATFLASKYKSGRAVAKVSEGFRLKPGGILISDPDKPEAEPVEARLETIDFDPVTDDMLITMSTTKTKTNVIEAAAKGGRSLVLSSEPFVRTGGKGGNPVTGKWAPRNGVERPTRHNLPVDIMLAGAPNEAS